MCFFLSVCVSSAFPNCNDVYIYHCVIIYRRIEITWRRTLIFDGGGFAAFRITRPHLSLLIAFSRIMDTPKIRFVDWTHEPLLFGDIAKYLLLVLLSLPANAVDYLNWSIRSKSLLTTIVMAKLCLTKENIPVHLFRFTSIHPPTKSIWRSLPHSD